jgi:hypothetical protein
LKEEKLKKIQESIRNNWGQVKPFKAIPYKSFNCYMFAICNTEPTEILTESNMCVSTIGEDIAYFGSIGNISGTTYETLEEYRQAFINDLRVLEIRAEECFEEQCITENTILIAFFSNFEEGMDRSKEEFHFLRYVPAKRRWLGKAGFIGGFQKFKRNCSIDNIEIIDQKRIGIFKLTLLEKNERTCKQ